MATFYNQARLTLDGRVVSSNQTEGEVLTRVTLNKIALSTDYGPDDNIVYAVLMTNTDTTDKTNITLSDNLGEFTTGSGLTVVPLSYVEGSLRVFINGIATVTPEAVAGPPLVISGIDIPAGGNAIVIFEARANEYAPRGAGADITNIVRAEGVGLCDELTDSATVETRDEPILTIAKAICPETISCGDELTYTFIIQNTGNTPVVATDNLVVTDLFQPPLENITVTLNGTPLTQGVGYTYNEETGEFQTTNGTITVPASTYVRDPETGIITTTPGVAILTITGII